METYSTLRAFADSWFLIAMVAFFLGTWVYAFWPSLKSSRDAAASIPFRDDETGTGCTGSCETCTCNTDISKELRNG
ncbi:cbb3-type cytochrome c oxidase subunit 3 [Pseudaestuariivita atlantica]|nr:cbb3-type cytochrome c oxidase subunit 3 [Pseudaestuariivita atlantica]